MTSIFKTSREYPMIMHLVIPAQHSDELSCGLGKVYRRTDISGKLIQSTPVISRQLGAKIRERELSGSPVISRFRAKAQTRHFHDQSPTL